MANNTVTVYKVANVKLQVIYVNLVTITNSLGMSLIVITNLTH